jgi:hypothetical protein
MAEPVSPVPPQAAPRNASRKRIILMLVLGGLVLAFGGCALFLGTANFDSSSAGLVPGIGAIGFIVGVLAFIVGILWGLARWIDRKRPPKPV